MKKIIIFALAMAFSGLLFAESEGEKLFTSNKPAEAVSVLEKEIESGNCTPSHYNYLGLAYYQLQYYKKSIETFQKGLSVPGTNKKVLAFNAGNACYAMGDFKGAVEYYSLAYKADRNYSAAVLNRANANLMLAEYEACIPDYELFLELEPEDPQDPKIRELLALLRKEVVRLEEERRLAEEEAARLAEEERIMQEEMARLEAERLEAERLAKEEAERLEAERLEKERLARLEQERLERERLEEEARLAEEKRRADEERRKKLLEEVASSLQNTDSTNLSSGAEDIIDYDQESELD